MLGKNGIKKNKIEGDMATPSGTYKLGKLYYRADRIKNIKTKLDKIIIKKNMGWSNSVTDKKYNKEINIIKKKGFEKLELNKNRLHATITSVNLFLIMCLIFINVSFLIQISTTN